MLPVALFIKTSTMKQSSNTIRPLTDEEFFLLLKATRSRHLNLNHFLKEEFAGDIANTPHCDTMPVKNIKDTERKGGQ